MRALGPARSLAISGSQGTRRGAGRAGAVRQGDILPDPGGRGGGNRGLHNVHTTRRATELPLSNVNGAHQAIINGARAPEQCDLPAVFTST